MVVTTHIVSQPAGEHKMWFLQWYVLLYFELLLEIIYCNTFCRTNYYCNSTYQFNTLFRARQGKYLCWNIVNYYYVTTCKYCIFGGIESKILLSILGVLETLNELCLSGLELKFVRVQDHILYIKYLYWFEFTNVGNSINDLPPSIAQNLK